MNRLDKAERLFFIFIIVYYAGTFFSLITGKQFIPDEILVDDADETNAVLSLLQWGMYAIVLTLGALRWTHFLKVLSSRKCLWVIIAFALLSVNWSLVPDLTARRSIVLLMTTLIGFYFAMRFSVREMMILMGWGFGIAAVINFGFAIAFPQYGTSPILHSGAWRGVLPQKNALARLMILSAITLMLLAVEHRQHRKWWLGGLVLSVALVFLSTSKTALLILVVLPILIYILRGARWRYTIALPAFLALFLIGSMLLVGFVGNQEAIFTALGRDITLTGRTQIWQIAQEKILQHFWLGYGYKSFWLADQGDSVDTFYVMSWQAPNGHNGYLDLMLDLGMIGFGAFALSFGMSFVRSITWLRLNPGSEGLFPLAFLSFLLLYNVTESSLIIEPTSMTWLLYVLITTSMLIHPVPLSKPSASL